MLDGLYIMKESIAFFHPLVVLVAFLAGAQVPNVVRLISALSRPLWALVRKI